MYDRVRLIALTIGVILFASMNLAATPITSFSTWRASVTGSPTELTFPSSSTSYTNHQLSLSGFLFTGPSLGPSTSNPTGATSSAITLTTPIGGETALLFHVRGANFNLILSDGESYSNLAMGFYGFSSATAITSLTVTTVSGTLTMDDFWYGVSSSAGQGTGTPPTDPTPEVATFFLTCGGLLILFGSGRRLMHKQIA